MTLLFGSRSGPCDGSDCLSGWQASVVSGWPDGSPWDDPGGGSDGGVAAAAVPVEGRATVVSAVVPEKTAPVVARVGDL